MKHIFDCFEYIHHSAICEFNRYRMDLEEMYGSKIKVIRMFWWFGWKVLFECEESEVNQ